MIQSQVWKMPPPLDAHVRQIWRMRGDGPAIHSLLPDVGGAEIVIFLSDPGRVVVGGDGVLADMRLVVGGLNRAAIVEHPRQIDFVGIQLSPACGCLLRATASVLRQTAVTVATLNPSLDDGLARWARDFAAGDVGVKELAAVIESHTTPMCDALVVNAALQMTVNASLTVAAVARAHGLCRRQFSRRFQIATGVSARDFVRICRFARAWRLVVGARPMTWAAVAAEAGYFDHSHLVRDFNEFVGCPPSDMFNNEWYVGCEKTSKVLR